MACRPPPSPPARLLLQRLSGTWDVGRGPRRARPGKGRKRFECKRERFQLSCLGSVRTEGCAVLPTSSPPPVAGSPHRCLHALKLGWKVCWEKAEEEEEQSHIAFLSHDISMLRLFETFLENTPQLTLLLYVILRTNKAEPFQGEARRGAAGVQAEQAWTGQIGCPWGCRTLFVCPCLRTGDLHRVPVCGLVSAGLPQVPALLLAAQVRAELVLLHHLLPVEPLPHLPPHPRGRPLCPVLALRRGCPLPAGVPGHVPLGHSPGHRLHGVALLRAALPRHGGRDSLLQLVQRGAGEDAVPQHHLSWLHPGGQHTAGTLLALLPVPI
ncbi:PREDICTED: XK-related protein 8 isoform X2 [Calidris pugnax]|uniref:XK-related protein 8 isoform X2 n=1 Tax=Calidris pugnax TaxID=198806 RepID=UPI00071D1065|nr:PREDICTED: XK-related protein 8 isoform X2 [Calidris pugnax]